MKVTLGERVRVADLVRVARHGVELAFSDAYVERVGRAEALVKKWVAEERPMYGITTGFGALYKQTIAPDKAAKLQENIVLSHSVSVGDPFSVERVRAILFAILQNIGSGHTGARLETAELIRDMLNRGVTPFVPQNGSVGYLCAEGHIGMTLIGKGRAQFEGEWMDATQALAKAGLAPTVLSFKEGLVLTNGSTSPTGLAALALYDMMGAVQAADVIAMMSAEILKATPRAYDERSMSVRPHREQHATADNLRRMLADSAYAQSNYHYRLQDALSLRGIPQAHGAAKKTLADALVSVENELNGCSDNPIIWPDGDDGEAISNCNCDAGYVGIEMDSAAIAATYVAKMSERRNNRLVNGNLSEMPWFLIANPGLNSGLMIPHYTQAGLLGDMRILSHPSTVDSVPTSGDQEDYVSMGYNACKKAGQVAENLEYILAIELLSAYEAQQFNESGLKTGSVTQAVVEALAASVPALQNDEALYPLIEHIRTMIHTGQLVAIAESKVGKLN